MAHYELKTQDTGPKTVTIEKDEILIVRVSMLYITAKQL